jgi:hypothetical protein
MRGAKNSRSLNFGFFFASGKNWGQQRKDLISTQEFHSVMSSNRVGHLKRLKASLQSASILKALDHIS